MFTYRKTNPVKLLHVIGDSRFGGAGRIILRLGQVAQAEGWDVDILTTDPVFQQAVRQHGLGLANVDVVRREIRPLWDLGVWSASATSCGVKTTTLFILIHPKADLWDGWRHVSRMFQ